MDQTFISNILHADNVLGGFQALPLFQDFCMVENVTFSFK
jgi:hypothetical protein